MNPSQQAIKIEGRTSDKRFAFINDVYEPMQDQHNKKTCYVARSVASRYLFHTGKSRWVISKVLDDGYACWAYVKDSGSGGDSPAGGGPWTVCDADGTWRDDANIRCSQVAASHDKFAMLRMSLDADMRKYKLIEKDDVKKMWRRLDYNGNNVVSLAEIDKMVVDLTTQNIWPQWLNNKPALMRAYKKTTLKDGDGDSWVEKKEFHALLLNIFWFNKLFLLFQQMDSGGDRRINVDEFCGGMNQMGLNLSREEAAAEFAKIDTNHGGQVLFVELCAYIRKRVNPDDNPAFDADIQGGEHCDTASYNKVHGHHHHHHASHHHAASHPQIHSREINFGAAAPAQSSQVSQSIQQSRAPTMGSRGQNATLRGMGESASRNNVVKPKSFADFDDLENKIKALCHSKPGLRKAWGHLDYNGNGVVSLAEIDKWVVENYPLLNHKPALMRCYKATMERKDEYVHRREFKKLVINVFYFNKLYWVFDQVDGDDRRITFDEFKMALNLCQVILPEDQARQEFQQCDKNGGGIILFDEFCHYFASKSCPEGMTDFVDDGVDRTHGDGTSGTVTGQHVHYSASAKNHTMTEWNHGKSHTMHSSGHYGMSGGKQDVWSAPRR